jgi:hypothetical protein
VICALADEVMRAVAAKAVMSSGFDFMASIFLGRGQNLILTSAR